MNEGSRKAIVAAFLANLGIAIAKFVGFAFTGSASLLAEAVHSVADTGNQGLLFLGGRRAARPASTEHPFGYGRERYFWSFVVAMVLFLLGGAFALYEGIDKLIHPHDIDSLWWAVGILGFAIVLESLSFRTALRETRHVAGRMPLRQFIRRSKSPELPVVLLEDSGALVGLALALIGVTLAKVTGNARFDALGSLSIGVLLCVIAIVLAVEMKGLLIGEAADPIEQDRIVAALTEAPTVLRLIHLRTEHLGPDEILVAAKLDFDHDLTMAQLAVAIDDVEARVRAVVPGVTLMYLEPDIARSAAPNP